MNKSLKLLVTMFLLTLISSVVLAQQPSAEVSATTPKQMQSAGQMQNMDKMASTLTRVAEMCETMMKKEMASAPYRMAAGIAFGGVLFIDLLLLAVLEVKWIKYWSRKLKSETTSRG